MNILEMINLPVLFDKHIVYKHICFYNKDVQNKFALHTNYCTL